MPDPFSLSAALTSLNLGLRSVDGLSSIGDKVKDSVSISTNEDVGRVYRNVRDFMTKRAVLGEAESYKENASIELAARDPVMSPNLIALRGLYGPEKHGSGIVYILYDKSGNGKTTAGTALLKHYHQLPSGESIKGLMLKGDVMGDSVALNLSSQLEATAVDGWIHILLKALDEPLQAAPSILILDGFNSRGEYDVNIKFVRALYQYMNGETNIFVVIVTSEPQIAKDLCRLNGAQRVIPLPGCYTGDDLTCPNWNETSWDRGLLVEMLHYKFPGSFTDEQLSFVKDGMAPLMAVINARTELRGTNRIGPPESPRKKRKEGE